MNLEQPVFAFTVHRSGSTLLGRLLNSHPNLVMWGEHSGIINKLAEIDFSIKYNMELQATHNQEWFAKFARDTEFRSRNFDPWTTPPQLAPTRAHAREMILGIFAAHLQDGQRWGFKEIRYHRPYVAEYLAALFPRAKFVLLQRDTVDAAVSNILSSWAQDSVKETMTIDLANEIIRDVVYALLAMSNGFEQIASKMPKKCFSLNYGTLKEHDTATLRRMFKFLGFVEPAGFGDRIDRVFATKFNQTEKKPKLNNILTSDFIRERAAALLPALKAEIETAGVDKARLVAETGLGKYSFVVGTRRSAYLRP